MISVRGIDHIVLRTANPNRLVAFYRDVLNCPVERELPPELGLIQLRAGMALIDIVAVDSELGRMGGEAPKPEGNNLDHFCLQVEAIDEKELARELRDKGVAVGDFSERYGAEGFGRSVYIADPDGNVVELRSTISAA